MSTLVRIPRPPWLRGTYLPLRARLTLWYTVLLAGALLVFSGTVYLLLSRSLVDSLDRSLQQRVNQVMPTIGTSDGRVLLPKPGEQPDQPFIPVVLLRSSGRPLAARLPSALDAWLARRGSSLPQRFSTHEVRGIRFATEPVENNNHRVGYILVWESMHSIDQARRSLLLLVVAAGPAFLLIAGLGGTLLAGRALRPVAQITQTAASISDTDLHRRVPVGPARDQLNELATTFNAMIERLEAAVERERRFTGDASHELRSPIAVILAEASLALEEPVESEEYRRALSVIQEQATGMQELVSALITLARVETLRGPLEAVPIADIVNRAVRQCGPAALAADVHVVTYVPSDLVVAGDATLLIRALRNIVDNAVKFSPSGGTVSVRARRDGPHVLLEVQDEGPGIAAAHLEKIFEPFYQIGAARTPGESHGLGLAICRRIVTAHGGEVAVLETTAGGTRFGIVLPESGVSAQSREETVQTQNREAWNEG